ncbi:MAG: DUF5106 domain-containing protein [Bacteroidales bacterium]|jgi:hypothetical protein|nr:DUF5106 domain-containing protein [Bacteroidales bacterium]MDD4395202.1 DUF5106 domain-containing protein [Bacteroidales bacterium]
MDFNLKKYTFFFLLMILTPFCSFSQNFNIKIISNNLTCDSLFLKGFDGKKEFTNLISISYRSTATLKQKGSLPPGIYRMCADTAQLFEFLISNTKQQTFVVNIDNNGKLIFQNNDENNHYIAYLEQIKIFNHRFQEINQTFEDAQKTMPQYMLQTLADNLIAKADQLTEEVTTYKQQLIKNNQGTLLASLVKLSFEIPPAPRHYYQNELLLRQYNATHFFDNYPYDDERVLNTPIAVFKMKEFAASLYMIDTQGGDTILNRVLTEAQISPTTYYAFFDHFEKIIGSLTSPYWSEDLFLVMLNNALNYNKLDDARKIRYSAQLETHSKNRVGSRVPNFKLMMSNGDTTSLYDIQAEYLLVYFQNPDCPTCSEVRQKLALNDDLNRAIDHGRLKLVTVYFEQDTVLWHRYLKEKSNPKYLHGWEYPHQIEDEKLFDLRIIPYMFLLDRDKKVIRKDILFNEISDYLRLLKIQ